MSQYLPETPCPFDNNQYHDNLRDSTYGDLNDTTTNLDFTTEFRASLRNVKPRRRQTAIRGDARNKLDFIIREDEELRVQRHSTVKFDHAVSSEQPKKRSSIAQPPQRPRRNVAPSNTSLNPVCQTRPVATPSNLSQAPKRHILPQNPCQISTVVRYDETLSKYPSPKGSKPARRGTIFIPTDDTTMPSVYMGVFSPLKNFDPDFTARIDSVKVEMTGLMAQIIKKKLVRSSLLVTSPKRVPLQSHTKPLQEGTVQVDHVGNPTGKENLPPGFAAQTNNIPKRSRAPLINAKSDGLSSAPHQAAKKSKSNALGPTVCSTVKAHDAHHNTRTAVKPAWNTGSQLRASKTIPHETNSAECIPSSPKLQYQVACKPNVPSRFIIPMVKLDSVAQSFPLLPEGVANPKMYEEEWLAHQEIAVTQLVNVLLQTATSKSDTTDHQEKLRSKLTTFYGGPDVTLLHRRIQGALLFGPLSLSHDAVENGHRLTNDIGKRKAFTDLWLHTYNNHLLAAVLEVVIGRLISTEPRISEGDRVLAPKDQLRMKKYIETFLIGSEDVKKPHSVTNPVTCPYQRTILRSLMLIKVLDSLKTETTLSGTQKLFQTGSKYKTSVLVVQALMQMLAPSVGDPMRALSRLGYSVNYCQYALEEYEYGIENLAVDLRDGVRLTRLVELLLYRSASQSLEHVWDTDGITTISLPSGESLSFVVGKHDWPLSQHLKIPCIGRAAKLFNIQIALSALAGVKGMEVLTQDINPEDIVDGFREKTMRLLWGLTSKWGLSRLIDWDDVKWEIKRLRHSPDGFGLEEHEFLDCDEADEHTHSKQLLKLWVRTLAAAHGLVVRNFNTSFADGKVFGAILSEYEMYLANCVPPKSPQSRQSLEHRLSELGCSKQFARLFANAGESGDVQHIFDRDFVLAAIAFLCSRLLAPSKQSRSATVIQRAWRMRWDRVQEKRKQLLKVLAQKCADEVQSKQRLRQAKRTIWCAWCRYKQSQVGPERYVSQTLNISANQNVEQEDIWLSL